MPQSGDQLFATRWVHVFEEDTADGDVYRPEDGDIPLSRRPRERIEFAPDGSARVFEGGPDDRLVARQAAVRIIDRSPDRLVVSITFVS
jgi:hypothetical protein